MLLGYIDESYVRGERYWLAVALVPAENVPQLTKDVQRVPGILPAEFSAAVTAELHGHALFHGTKGFKPLEKLIDLRIRLYRRGLRALATAATDVIFIGVKWNDPALPNDLNLHRMQAVRGMLPVIEDRVERLQEHCLLIADEEETTRRDFAGAVRDHKVDCVEGCGECRIIDNVLFVDSRDSPGVQCADLAAYLHHRVDSDRDNNSRARAANRKLYRVLEGCAVNSLVIEGPPLKEASPVGAA
ncbi:MAG TPA: DUF3800 domain-containing protein [Solirubrobacterales bacterium]|nr:DUF3800 domain-containing protein [Solirubrobacterales bacterium]